MRKQVTLPHTNQTITVDDSLYVESEEVVYVEHKDGAYELGPYSMVAFGAPKAKKVWKIVPDKAPHSIKLKLSMAYYGFLWWFVSKFRRAEVMRQKFQINAGISDIKDTYFVYAKKAGADTSDFFKTGLVKLPRAKTNNSKYIKSKK